MKFKTIIVDDEVLAIERLERLLIKFNDSIEIIDTATDGFEAVTKINSSKPDLIFLDIQMPELNGFEVLEKLKKQPYIIFTTAYDEYALKAFETNSIDYLLKPIDSKRLRTAIDKLQNITDNENSELQKSIKKLLAGIHSLKLEKIKVRIGDKIKFINFDEIYFFQSDQKYVQLFTFDKHYLLSKSLNALEDELDNRFVRIHRSVIINSNHIDEVVKMFKGSYQVKMTNQGKTNLTVSRKLKSNLGL